RSECQTEQYFSRDSAMARSTLSGAISPDTSNRRSTRTSRCGSSGARSARKRARRPRRGWRPFSRMWTTSTDMHPARARARACTGEGPAVPSESTTTGAWPAWPRKRRSPSQVSSTSTGGLSSANLALHGHEARDALLQRRMRAEEAAEGLAREGVHDEQVRGGRLDVVHGHALGGVLELGQRARQPVGLADEAPPAL